MHDNLGSGLLFEQVIECGNSKAACVVACLCVTPFLSQGKEQQVPSCIFVLMSVEREATDFVYMHGTFKEITGS